MNDQGEKIVFLARELLKAGVPETYVAPKAAHITMSFKTLCFTTMLAAASGAAVTAWVHQDERPLNRYEMTELKALLFYAAKTKGLNEEALRHDVTTQLGIANFDAMNASDFATARHYLQEKAQ